MLKNEQIALRPIQESDKDNLLRWINNPDAQSIGHQFDPITDNEIDTWIKELPNKESLEYFIISLTASKTDLGYIGLKRIDRRNQNADLEFIIGQQEYQGRGFEGQALMLMLQYAFEHLNLNKIRMRIPDSNRAGTQFADAAGFTEEGKLREDFYEDGNYHPVFVYGMLKSEWMSIKTKQQAGGQKPAEEADPNNPESQTPPPNPAQ